MPRSRVEGLLLADVEKILDAISLSRLVEAEQVFRLRRELPEHTSDIADAYAVARACGWTLTQTGMFVAYLQHRARAR